uniref:UDP-N-acetylglucosamine--dolichyl-phosphate N-acetylglucosaminephosphotransferase n=1 Tax=Diacronema lutheri TaxID=2081491 RepID=A0A7R9UMY0_DIALT|mmetsp:Transcript_17483/g.54349  ORF Transcript_17483/g.54349 Transcript_17483/m.54349 type:complete len:426 (+) Transcript_17483:2-1279(+)
MPLLQPPRACVLLSLIGGLATLRVVPHMRASFAKAGLTGIDLNKQTTRRLASGELVRPYEGVAVPEAMGAVSCAVYLVCLFLFIPLPFAQPGVPAYSDGAFPHAQLARLLCALLSICCMCFLGFADNVLDLRWRDRLILPLAASLPVLMTYAATGGVTTVKVPAAAQALLGLGGSVDIGALYFVYISLLAIFCTNAINILAGVNGLEVGQSVVIGLTIAAFNCVQLARWPEDSVLVGHNLFSLYVVLPFITTSLGLLWHNWYPASVFVGDTYCYFAGMTFAVAGILGHFSKTMLLFFLPQLVNFVYSLPQLALIIPCPRHRMPGYLPATDQLALSTVDFRPDELTTLGRLAYRALAALRAVHVRERADGSVAMSNLTIINFVLHVCGPMREASLTRALLGVQLASSVLAFAIRYPLAALLYDVVK